jgi:hypothetical protein
MLSNIIICATSLACGFLCGMLFDSHMWVSNYKKNKRAVLILFEKYSHAI